MLQTRKNADLDYRFDDVFAKLFASADSNEKTFLTFHKYCLRKKYVSFHRKNDDIGFVNSILYSLFLKLDSYGMLSFKIFLNLVAYLLVFPVFCVFRTSDSDAVLREVRGGDFERDIGIRYYPGSLNNFLKKLPLISNIVSFKLFLKGLRSIKTPRVAFLRLIAENIGGAKLVSAFTLSLFFFFVLYSYCYGIAKHLACRFSGHCTYGAVIPPQKIFSLAFLSESNKTRVISHGNFHDPQCIFQPANQFIDISEVKSHSLMAYEKYFCEDELLNPFKAIPYTVREGAYPSLTHLFDDDTNTCLERKTTPILVFSSTYDCGIGRDPYFGLLKIIRVLFDAGFQNLEIKLHPAESVLFFKVLYYFNFKQFPRFVKSVDDFSGFGAAFGLPSTFITQITTIPKIYVYSPIEYFGFDFVHKENVIYFSEIS